MVVPAAWLVFRCPQLLENVACLAQALGNSFEPLRCKRNDSVDHALDICERNSQEITEIVPDLLCVLHA